MSGRDGAGGRDVDGLDELRRFGVRQIWPAGALLLRQNGHPERLFVIERGAVAVWDDGGPERRLVQIVQAGASIGDLPVLLEEPCLYTATAHGETETLAFSRQMVQDLLEVDPQTCFLWLRLLARRIAPGYPRNVALAGRSSGERLARFLLYELEARDGASIDLTQSDLASAIGLSRQSVSQALGVLERLDVLERGRGGVHVLDVERLRAIAAR